MKFVELHTGGEPEQALTALMLKIVRPGHLYTTFVRHDDGCPCLGGFAPMRSCTCDVVVVEFEPHPNERAAAAADTDEGGDSRQEGA